MTLSSNQPCALGRAAGLSPNTLPTEERLRPPRFSTSARGRAPRGTPRARSRRASRRRARGTPRRTRAAPPGRRRGSAVLPPLAGPATRRPTGRTASGARLNLRHDAPPRARIRRQPVLLLGQLEVCLAAQREHVQITRIVAQRVRIPLHRARVVTLNEAAVACSTRACHAAPPTPEIHGISADISEMCFQRRPLARHPGQGRGEREGRTFLLEPRGREALAELLTVAHPAPQRDPRRAPALQ